MTIRNPKVPTQVGQLIRRARESRNMSQRELADAVGTTQQTIEKIEGGITKHSSFLPTILPKLGIPLTVLVNEESATIARGQDTTNQRITHALGELPVHAAVEGGKGALIVSAEPVEYVARPAPLLNVRNGYGVLIVEDSMSPEFDPGDIALIHPHLPPKSGETCVFYSEQEDGTTLAIIKRLRRVSADAWHVTQWNPAQDQPRDFTLKRSEWQTCHVTVGRYSKR
jgi:transcriptional regulator with XRE-family HTH domain